MRPNGRALELQFDRMSPILQQPRTPSTGVDPPSSLLNELAADVVSRVFRTAQALKSQTTDHFAEFGLNDVRYTVLCAVEAAGAAGCSQAELAESLQLSESNICTLVERMRSDGYLDRQRSKSDRRKRIVVLAEHGRNVLAKIAQCHGRRMSELLQPLSGPQRAELIDLLDRLHEACCEQREAALRSSATSRHAAPPKPHFEITNPAEYLPGPFVR